MDRVFLLSSKEASLYFESDLDRMCEVTPYAVAIGTKVKENHSSWWLRTPGRTSADETYVDQGGHIIDPGSNASIGNISVRPAIWILNKK